MSPRDARAFLADIIAASDAITSMIPGLDLARYSADLEKRSAVERQLFIIGEAMAQLRKLDPSALDQIPRAHQVIAVRNILAHSYYSVRDDIIWELAQIHVPVLWASVQQMLRDWPAP